MEVRVGEVTHFYNRLSVAVLDLSGELQVGDVIHIAGYTTDLSQRVESMEIEHRKVQSVGPGADVALEVAGRVRVGDVVYKVVAQPAVE